MKNSSNSRNVVPLVQIPVKKMPPRPPCFRAGEKPYGVIRHGAYPETERKDLQ